MSTETTPEITPTPEPEIQQPVKRSDMRVRLALKDGGEIECMIMPTLVWIKTEVQRLARRETVLANKWNGEIERMKKLVEEYEKLISEGAPEAEAKAIEIDKFQESLDATNTSLSDIRSKKAKLCIHYPPLNGKQLTADDINWDGTDEKEIENAQRFFFS
jgi:hypothetical protein